MHEEIIMTLSKSSIELILICYFDQNPIKYQTQSCSQWSSFSFEWRSMDKPPTYSPSYLEAQPQMARPQMAPQAGQHNVVMAQPAPTNVGTTLSLSHVCNGLLRFTSVATPADLWLQACQLSRSNPRIIKLKKICKPNEIYRHFQFYRELFLLTLFQTVIVQQPIVRPPNYIWLSCVVFWLCNWIAGAIAFALSRKFVLKIHSHSLGSTHVVVWDIVCNTKAIGSVPVSSRKNIVKNPRLVLLLILGVSMSWDWPIGLNNLECPVPPNTFEFSRRTWKL